MKTQFLLTLSFLMLPFAANADLETYDHLSHQNDIMPILEKHCASCHNENTRLPNWRSYDTCYERRDFLRMRVYEFRNMPPGNYTGMTEAEREAIALWVDQGAHE